MSTLNRAGRRLLTDLPKLQDYSEAEILRAPWPAIERYRALLLSAHDLDNAADSASLRVFRHQSWLRSALATAHEKASARDVCEFWSRAADDLILKAWTLSGCETLGYALLALGKLGANELNLSSDVDLILVRSDDSSVDTKAVRLFQALLSEYTEFGFCLRVDLTLRPGGKSAALVPSLSELEYHYGYHGETWERLAFVRMRILAGEPKLLDALNEFTKKFSFRRHLDFTLLDELKGLRSKIRQEKFETRPGCFHLKLGPGGIRELELFVHALQVIHGGRHPALRTNSTSEALRIIKEKSFLPAEECDELLEIYWYLRTLENKLHAYEDQQNYLVDLVHGHPSLPTAFAEELKRRTARVSAIADTLFNQGEAVGTQVPENDDEQRAWLAEKGFSTQSQQETWPELLSATALSRKSDLDEAARMNFLKGFVSKLADSGVDRDLGLSILLDFIRGTRAKASFFTLLNRETRVRDDLARLFSISPYLGSILASRPELIDEFIFRKQAEPSQDLETLLEELAERRLLVELIAANQFLSDGDLDRLNQGLTDSADNVCMLLLESLKREYGGNDVSLIAMGKWGGRELGLRSDLDFVFVTPNEPQADDHKLARRFLARITEPHRGGAIFAVDMRLRPSGNAGPILISESRLKGYLDGSLSELDGSLDSKAAAWERQAYLRARPLSPISFSPAQASSSGGLIDEDLTALEMIRSKLFFKDEPGVLNLKLSDGGLADVEFTAQIALLARREFSLDPSTSGMVQYLERVDETWSSIGAEVRERYEFLRRVEQLFQLTTSQSGSKLRTKSDEFKRLALVMKLSPEELEQTLTQHFQALRHCLEKVRSFARR